MIVPEIQLGELIDTIPTYDINGQQSLPLTYSWGNHKTLLNELAQRRQNESSLYPLVWFMTPYKRNDAYTSTRVNELRLILAINTLKDPLSPERYDLTFRYYLEPNLALIKQALTIANNIRLLPIRTEQEEDEFWDVDVFPNYGDPATFQGFDQNQATDYWDAMQITFRARFTQNCLNVTQNQYNTEIITQWPYN